MAVEGIESMKSKEYKVLQLENHDAMNDMNSALIMIELRRTKKHGNKMVPKLKPQAPKLGACGFNHFLPNPGSLPCGDNVKDLRGFFDISTH